MACPICLEGDLRQPAACIPCGHIFCLSCITQWVRTTEPMFTIRYRAKCPQCRAPVSGIQKLFLSNQPIAQQQEEDMESVQELTMTHEERLNVYATQTITHVLLMSELVAVIIFTNCLDYYQQAQHMVASMKRRVLRQWGTLRRQWVNLSVSARYWISVACLLVLALTIEDLQQERGVYASVVKPVTQLIFSALHRIVGTALFLAARCVLYLLKFFVQVVLGIVEVIYIAMEALAFVLLDLLQVPWILLSAFGHLLHVSAVILFRLLERTVTVCLFFASVSFLVSLFHDGWKDIVRHVALVVLEWAARQLPQGRVNQGEEFDAFQPDRTLVEFGQRSAEVVRILLTAVERELRQGEEEVAVMVGTEQHVQEVVEQALEWQEQEHEQEQDQEQEQEQEQDQEREEEDQVHEQDQEQELDQEQEQEQEQEPDQEQEQELEHEEEHQEPDQDVEPYNRQTSTSESSSSTVSSATSTLKLSFMSPAASPE